MPRNEAAAAKAAARMKKLAGEVQRAKATSVKRAALDSKKAINTELHRAVPSGRLRNVGRGGARLSVRYDMVGDDALVRAIGPWPLVENPIKPHEIKPRRRRGRTARAVLTPAGPRASVQHPGVANPKRPWRKGMARVIPSVRKSVMDSYSAAFRRGAK